MKINVVSGYFDPIHNGHIDYFENASKNCDKLVVFLNNDEQAKLKKGGSFMELAVRKRIVESIKYVDEVIVSIDKDLSVCNTFRWLRSRYPDEVEIYFVNGGDRDITNIPEYCLKDEIGLKFSDDAGDKVNSSSKYYKT